MPNNITPDASANLELLKRAAKAAGIGLEWPQDFGGADFLSPRKTSDWQLWNPLTDDGDALRLAMKLKISIEHPNPYDGGGFVTASVRRAYYKHVLKQDLFFNETLGDDKDAAARRAIVRAAAALAA